ncbi:MAG: transglutaminase domain-containing protein [Anaeromyxobacter sp.]
MSGLAALGLGILVGVGASPALEVAAPSSATLRSGRASYRMELAGVHVGAAALVLSCAEAGCSATWTVDLVLPDEAGGERTHREDRVAIDRAGRAPDGAVPAMIAPVVLGNSESAPGCVAARDERTGERGKACRAGAGKLTVMGVAMEVVFAADGLPDEVRIPAQRARYVRSAEATPPATPPRLFGTKVSGPAAAHRFCGVPLDAPVAATKVIAGLPPARGEGASCRAITQDWLARAERAGHRGRVTVGVVRTPDGWAWHAWAEVEVRARTGARGSAGSRWVPVDPTFGESPARSPRFTIARWTPGDEASRLRAGERVLGCWGQAAR